LGCSKLIKSALKKLRQIALHQLLESAIENLRQIAEGLPIAEYDSDFFAGLENALLRINDPIPTSDSEEDEITENDRVDFLHEL